MIDVNDIIGKKIGKRTIISYAGRDKRSNPIYNCRCECGRMSITNRYNLLNNHSTSCRYCARKAKRHTKPSKIITVEPYINGKAKSGINTKPRKNNKSLVGQKFGRLTVLEDTGKRYYGYVVYKCQCDCGNIFEAPMHNIKAGQVKSCGCLLQEIKDSWVNKLKKTNKYEFGKFGIGYTQKGEKFYFDIEDYDKLKDYCWRYDNNKLVAYVRGSGKLNLIDTAWKIILNEKYTSKKVKFKNGNYWDLRKKNLIIY